MNDLCLYSKYFQVQSVLILKDFHFRVFPKQFANSMDNNILLWNSFLKLVFPVFELFLLFELLMPFYSFLSGHKR